MTIISVALGARKDTPAIMMFHVHAENFSSIVVIPHRPNFRPGGMGSSTWKEIREVTCRKGGHNMTKEFKSFWLSSRMSVKGRREVLRSLGLGAASRGFRSGRFVVQ